MSNQARDNIIEDTFSTITTFCACDKNDKGIVYATFIRNEGNENALKELKEICDNNNRSKPFERHLFQYQRIPRKIVLEMMKYPLCDYDNVMIDEEISSFFKDET